MVTGGYFFTSDFVTTYLDSTEVLIKDAFSWKVLKKKPLPQPMAKMGIISFQNKIFMIGIREAFKEKRTMKQMENSIS